MNEAEEKNGKFYVTFLSEKYPTKISKKEVLLPEQKRQNGKIQKQREVCYTRATIYDSATKH